MLVCLCQVLFVMMMFERFCIVMKSNIMDMMNREVSIIVPVVVLYAFRDTMSSVVRLIMLREANIIIGDICSLLVRG